MTSKLLKLTALTFLLSTSQFAAADMYAPSPSCYKPSKPYKFNSQWEIDNFNDEVQAYKRCINRFIEEQNEAMNTHQEAANEAIEEWNRFVNYELN